MIEEGKRMEADDTAAHKGKESFNEFPTTSLDGPLLPPPDNDSLTTAFSDGIAPQSFVDLAEIPITQWTVPRPPSAA